MPRGSEDIRHDATEGTAPASGTAVRPVAWANRRNARSDVTIAFAVHVLRPAVQSTMNAVTLPASRPLADPQDYADPVRGTTAFDQGKLTRRRHNPEFGISRRPRRVLPLQAAGRAGQGTAGQVAGAEGTGVQRRQNPDRPPFRGVRFSRI